MTHRPAVAVVGGGIAGLAAAWQLSGRAEVTVYEAADTVGGKLRTGTVAGIDVDLGAEAMLARRPEAVELARAAGLELLAPRTTSASLRAGGALHPLPPRTMLGIPADLEALRASGVLSAAALRAVAGEPSREPLPPLESDVAVGTLARARLGAEVTDRLVEPLLGGVYAGRADLLSTQATMPALFDRLSTGGSLVRAAQAVVGAAPATPAAPVFASIAGGGLGRLPQALAASGRFGVRTGATVRRIDRVDSRFRLTVGPGPEPEYLLADAVIVAVPAAKAARLLTDAAPVAATELAGIDYASVAIATLVYRGLELPAGSGLLVSPTEGLAVKGITITSQKWPLRADPGVVVLRASVGRHGEPQVLQREDGELIGLVRTELRTLLGLSAEPIDSLLTRWGGGLPQYAVGHVARVGRIKAAVAAVPGLAVCGAAYEGVGVPACVSSATSAASQVAAALDPRGQ